MLKPIKTNIMNGEVLKRYNDLSVYKTMDEKEDTINYGITPPIPIENKKKLAANEELMYEHSSSIMIPHIDMPKLTNESPFPRVINLNNLGHSIENFHKIHNHPIEFEHKTEENKISKLSANSILYRFDPNSNFSIQLRPSKDGKFLQRFVNISDIKIQPNNMPQVLPQPFENVDSSERYHFSPNMTLNNNNINYFTEKYNHYQNFQDPDGLHLVWNPKMNTNYNNALNNNDRSYDYKNLKRKSTSSLNHLLMIQTDKLEESNYNSQKSINNIVKSDDFYIKKSPKRIKKQSKSVDNSKFDRNETPIPIEIEEPISIISFKHISFLLN
jgi:hypothetical protein